jgi:putative phage-type endonuclease
MYVNDIHLDELEDVTDFLEFPDPEFYMSDADMEDFIETSMMLMGEYVEHHPHALFDCNFREKMLEDVKEIQYEQWIFNEEEEDDILEELDDMEEDLDYLLECAFLLFMDTFYPEMAATNKDTTKDTTNKAATKKNENDMENEADSILELSSETSMRNDKIAQRIRFLKNIPQHAKRTPEWYEFRHNLITASNAWKAFGTQASINQLIYEKCHPIDMDSSSSKQFVNTEGPLHWGQKYEPISVMLYEDMFQTKVDDFGCIPHATYPFLGASPDGIVVDKNSSRFGRMLEIKNPISRIITGIPKKEYWIQIQLQMEVCDLDECDFLETKFVEYENEAAFNEDVLLEDDDADENNDCPETDNTNVCISKDHKQKGKMICFQTKEGKPIYVYKPLDLISLEEIEEWEQETICNYESEHEFIKTIGWKLEAMSCITIQRNKEWFENSIQALEKVWKMIEKERVTGYEHRKANKREKMAIPAQKEGVCLLKIDRGD